MQDLRIVTSRGLLFNGVRYDHPELQTYRAVEEQKLRAEHASVIVRVEVREHAASAKDGTRYRVDLAHVRTLRGRLVCLARPVPDLDVERALLRRLTIHHGAVAATS
jgi:hypothetical protein